VVVVLDAQRLSRLSQCDREVNAVRGTRRHNVAAAGCRSAAVAIRWQRESSALLLSSVYTRTVFRRERTRAAKCDCP
jgi:hypothetical protein